VIIGNPDLRPEVGFNADAGLVGAWSDLGALSSLRFELVAFGSLVDDVIVFVQNSQSSVRSENIDKAEITGLESSLRMNLWDWLLVSANHTFLHAINRSDTAYHSGKRLPGRPEHEIYARIEARLNQRRQAVGFWLDMDYAGRNYLDPANLKEDALARLLFGAGLRLHRFAEGLTVTLQVKNLFDTYVLTDSDGLRRPLRDFEAFPLPGRTIMTTVHWKI
jgi:outer membrane receptor protein involved in Fe transport